MSVLRVLSRRGDDNVQWDPRAAAAGDPEALAAVREAGRIFAEVRARGGAAFALNKDKAVVRIDVFDPEIEQIILAPRAVGG